METIPALAEYQEERLDMALPRGRGVVHVIGGGQVAGDITLTDAWVVVDLVAPDDYGATVRCFPLATVRSVDFRA